MTTEQQTAINKKLHESLTSQIVEILKLQPQDETNFAHILKIKPYSEGMLDIEPEFDEVFLDTSYDGNLYFHFIDDEQYGTPMVDVEDIDVETLLIYMKDILHNLA